MSTKHKTRFETLRVLIAVSAVMALALGCGQGDSARTPASADEYDIITQQQEEALQTGAMPLGQAKAEYGSKPRDQFAALTPQPSEDESAVNGWSFKGAAPVAPGEVTMPPECTGAGDPMACWGQKLSRR